jgi:hypothetical protein
MESTLANTLANMLGVARVEPGKDDLTERIIEQHNKHMSSETFRGIFYFKKTSNGNLFGESTNLNSKEVSPESAARKAPSVKGEATDDSVDPWGYCGDYISTWYESKSVAELCTLTIRPNTQSSAKYVLVWENFDGTKRFEGTGMICDGILIGEFH